MSLPPVSVRPACGVGFFSPGTTICLSPYPDMFPTSFLILALHDPSLYLAATPGMIASGSLPKAVAHPSRQFDQGNPAHHSALQSSSMALPAYPGEKNAYSTLPGRTRKTKQADVWVPSLPPGNATHALENKDACRTSPRSSKVIFLAYKSIPRKISERF